MTKEAYLEGVREALVGRVPESTIRETCDYYGRYIEEQMADGQSIDEVLTSLGPANLIAKSVVDVRDAEMQKEIEITQEEERKEEKQAKKIGLLTKILTSKWRILIPILAVLILLVVIVLIIIAVVYAVWTFLPAVLLILFFFFMVWFFIKIKRD